MSCFRRTADRVIAAGPPCAGKTTFAQLHLLEGDEVLDWDVVAAELTGAEMHTRPRDTWGQVEAEFRDRAFAMERGFIIRSAPTAAHRRMLRTLYRADQVVVLATQAAICHLRLAMSGRPEEAVRRLDPAIKRWWREYEPIPGELVLR